MYFSKRDESITYINHYSGLLEVEGKGFLLKEDADVWPTGGEHWQRGYDTLSVTEGITGLGEGYLDSFSNIGCLILGRTVESVATSPELDKKLRKNKVLIRGEYNTFAEKFAQEKGLKFLHCDIPLAEDDIEIAHEHDIITLRFHESGLPDIHYNCFTPGSSAGSYGGGEYANELPKDFYVGCTMEQFANNFPERLHEQLMANEMLRRFLDAANSREKFEGRTCPMQFICYPKCTTCQKAKKWLDANGVAFDERHIKDEKPTLAELKVWHRQSGLPLKKFFNTSGLQYKELHLKDKLPTMSEAEQFKLLASDGMLVKRPLLVGDGFVLVGFKEEEWKARIL